MDNQNNDWLKEFLEKKQEEEAANAAQQTAEELGPDEAAVASAGLTHPDEMELERIVQETIAQNWGDNFGEELDTQETNDTQFFAPQQEVPEPEQPAQPQVRTFINKLRPKAKKGYGLWGIPHILSTVIWLFLIVVIGVTLGRTLWLCAEDLLALGKTGQEVTITIEEDDTVKDVAKKLHRAGLIDYANLFEAFADITGKGDGIHAGTVTFNGSTVYDYNALINALSYTSTSLATVNVTIPEGYSCAQIFALLEENGVCSVADLEKYAADGELDDYWFLEGVKRGHKYCLEGFLFPDTYNFYIESEPEKALEKMLDGFNSKFTDRLKEKFEALKKDTGLNLSLYEVIIMASMVEKEKASDLEGYNIASVFYNRLTHASSFPLLQSDATILYATEYYNAGQLITESQINASPYNTYTQPGLPPTPICNPGLYSLDAALEPEDTSYYYFVYDEEAGVSRFSKTLNEHNNWLNKLGY